MLIVKLCPKKIEEIRQMTHLIFKKPSVYLYFLSCALEYLKRVRELYVVFN